MHIIIPMSGIGKRFIDEGYIQPKPLIEVDGKTMIEHIVNLFPNENKFTFICNSNHLLETNMVKILKTIKNDCNIVEIPKHKKGPVYAVSKLNDLIDDNEEVIVNYCDFGTFWNYNDFLSHTRSRNADGAIVAYKGFHPHMLGTTNYAFMRSKKQWMLEIKEKEPFTNNRLDEYASNGTYYFRRGDFVKKYFNELIKKKLDLNGEFYVSLVYNLMVEDNLKISIYEIQHMLQWGTPMDLEEYNKWSEYFKNVITHNSKKEPQKNTVTIIPLAGKGSRFTDEGYSIPKPLLEVSGKPMIIQSANSLPNSEKKIFVALKEHLENFPLEKILKNQFKNCEIVSIDEVTEGQAITCDLGLQNIDKESSLIVAAADNGMLYNSHEFESMTKDKSIDAIIFTFRKHVSSKINPNMYGWVKNVQKEAKAVSVKVPISDNPYMDHAIVGTFYFKKIELFKLALNEMIKNNIRVNNEFYVDTMLDVLINLGYKVKIFEVENYICWGTPNDYKTFNYWQSFFHKCDWHPYSVEKDSSVDSSAKVELINKFNKFSQTWI